MPLDIGVGILAALGVGALFHVHTDFLLIVAGVIFALLPDFDFLVSLVARGTRAFGKYGHEHRDLFHYPILYLLFGAVIIVFVADPVWAVLFVIASFLHFLHDSVGIGWGIQWLFPFSSRHFFIAPIYAAPNKKLLPAHFLYVWKHEEIDKLACEYGDEHWFRNIYLKLHPYALFEFAVFLFSIMILIFSLW